MRSEFCGRAVTHDGHAHRTVWWRKRIQRYQITVHSPKRWCGGALTNPCGSRREHGPHWYGEFGDELCRGFGLGAVCPHGVQMLNECADCP